MGVIRWYKNMPVGLKIALAPIIIMLSLIVIGGLAISTTTKMQTMLQQLADKRLPTVADIVYLEPELTRLNGEIFRSIAMGATSYSQDEIKKVDDATLASMDKVEQSIKKFSGSSALNEEQKQLLKEVTDEFVKYHRSALRAINAKVDSPMNAVGYLSSMELSYDKIKQKFDHVVKLEIEQASSLANAGNAMTNRDLMIIIFGLAISFVLSLIVSVFTVRFLSRALKNAADMAKSMSEGDFRHQATVDSKDATGQLLQALSHVSNNMSKIVASIRQSANEVYLTSENMANSNQTLSNATQSVSHALKETAVTLEQLSSSIKTSADGASQASQLASDTRNVAYSGEVAMKDVVDTMGQIDQRTKDINEIVNVIDSIAFQTNILALNAAVEAARAGEQGRGFAVVASEVRSLAKRSSDAAHEVRVLIGSSVTLINNGAKKVQTAGHTMSSIMESIERLTSVVKEISQALSEQSQGVSLVTEAVNNMDQNSRSNAEIVEHSTEVTLRLERQANQLTGLISTFKAVDSPPLIEVSPS